MGPVLISFLLIIITGITCAAAITTIHHDKPESVTISAIKTSTTEVNLRSSTVWALANITATLSPSERKKRLLPYQNFYFNQPFNRPHQAGVSAQQYKDYAENKKPEVEPANYRPVDNYYQSGHHFTPFLESNALPGHFRPMINHANNPQKFQYVFVDRPPVQEDKDTNVKGQTPPDLGAIYDKLAQLKLRQQAMQQHKTPYGYRLVPQHRFRERPQKLHIDFRPDLEGPRYKIQPSKTTIETFTATNIDIPAQNEEEKYEQPRYHHIPTPSTKDELRTKYRENTRPFIQHQIAIEVPQSSLPLTFSPNVVRKPSPKERPRTYILIQQGKPSPKQPTVVFRKPKPTAVVDESFVAEKYVPIIHPKTHYHSASRPIYQQEPQYPEAPQPLIYENNFEAQYQVTPKPQQNIQALDDNKFIVYGSPQPQTEPITPAPYSDNQDYYQFTTTIKVPPYQDQEYAVTPKLEEPKGTNSLADLLRQLQNSNTLPQTLTPDNIDNSIKTLVKILNALKQRQKEQKPIVVQEEYEYDNEAGVDLGGDVIDTQEGGTPGKPGVDYPALSSIPKTSFSCKTQRYKGFFGDPDTNCQVWHYCDLNGGQASFLCPNGTIFSQVALTCDWWYNVKCASTAQLYVLNERLYKYIIPLSPKFPEDYSGPLVDKYLAMKFQEMEEKLRKQKKGKGNSDSNDEENSTESDDTEEEEEEEEGNDAAKEESQVLEETETSKPNTTTESDNLETTTINTNT